MANSLLNFADKYSKVSEKLQAVAGSADYYKLYFTKDGHIITHGTDYIPWGSTGLIPSDRLTDISIGKLPIATGWSDAATDKLWNSKTTKDIIEEKINASFTAQDAMRFKGTISVNTKGLYSVNGGNADTTLSTTAVTGDTYRVVANGTYFGHYCEIGDLLICVTDGDSSTSTNATWTVALTNINGLVTHTINNITHLFYSNDEGGTSFTIFAPTDAGTANLILVSGGKDTAPKWMNPGDLKIGTAASADKVANKLKAGTGLSFGSNVTYDGSAERTLSLVSATSNSLGGVIVGDHITVDSTGKISITQKNVEDALGLTNTGITGEITNLKRVVSNTYNGLAPLLTTSGTAISSGNYLLSFKSGETTPSWRQLTEDAFTNTWREIQLGGVSIENNKLNISPSSDILVGKSIDTDKGVTSVSFLLSWYNMDSGKYELPADGSTISAK